MPTTWHKTGVSRRVLCMLGVMSVLAGLSIPNASAISFKPDPQTGEAAAVGALADDPCPTLTEAPRSVEAWFNTDDMEYRGYLDPKNQRSWSFANKAAQLVCGAAPGAKLRLGMYFIRAIGTTDRPESDSEIVWRAMEYVHKNRGVDIQFVLDGGSISSASAKNNIKKRLKGIASISWCYNGCLNTNAATKFPFAINHEKFLIISSTIWGGPIVYSSSGQFARSQVRTYWQEATLIFGDVQLYRFFADRFTAMKACAAKSQSKACKSGSAFKTTATSRHTLSKQRGFWVDKLYRHYTDAGRGTTVSFSPQPADVTDYYTNQFGDVDCTVDNKIRVAMYRLTDTRAAKFVDVVKRLKNRGCDVQILLSQEGGATTISAKVAKQLKAAGLTKQVRCTALPIHTKLILIGPADSNNGRVMFGTANMSTSALRYSEEHVITLDARRASGQYAEDIRQAYGVYLAGWNELNQGNKVCH